MEYVWTFKANPTNWSWAQWTILILCALHVLANFIQHGKPKPHPYYDFGESLIDCVFWLFVLLGGGFFH